VLVAGIQLEERDRILGINLRGTFIYMKYELAQMVRQGGGVVVNTSSGAGVFGVAPAPRPVPPPSMLLSA
jgi:NAD(P)-dependent dehydrogenase (short-subunit alcohol dehydrogenase family)